MKHRMIAAFSLLIAMLLLAAGFGGCTAESDLERYETTREMLGTFVKITVYAESPQQAELAGTAAFQQIENVERLMSRFHKLSEIWRLSRYGYWSAVDVSDETLEVLLASLEYSKLTDGAFDITVGPLVELWRSAGRNGKMPDDNAIEEAMKSVGIEYIEIDAPAKKVKLLRRNMVIDLGAIAKGYAVDRAIEALKENGTTSALVNAGGDIAVLGNPPGRDSWKVGIQKPGRQDERMPNVLHLNEGAVATSGDYERYAEIDGKRFSHIIDPRTGRPVETVSSVTVIASSATRADALATAFSVLGPEKSLQLASQHDDVEVMFVSAPQNHGEEPTIIFSEGFESFSELTE